MGQITDELLALIDQLAVRLQKPAAAVWEIAYRQAIADGFSSLFVAVLCLAYILFFVWALRQWKDILVNDEDLCLIVSTGGVVIFILALSIFVVETVRTIKIFINPSYYALEYIQAMLRW